MNNKTILDPIALGERDGGYWPRRIAAELKYAVKLCDHFHYGFEDVLAEAGRYLLGQHQLAGCIGKEAVQQAETILRPLHPTAKGLRLCCVSHAHLDMNWLWRWDETVTTSLDIFRTMLDLLEEYPKFTFSQSQAVQYKILEDYDPGMLEEVRKRIHEGRWEVTASTWVEGDKNMPCGESLVRQILYAKQYLQYLLGLAPDAVTLDYEPDLFGHSAFVPEILANAGIRHYYHCRGSDSLQLYRWRAPSGKTILAHHDLDFYFDNEVVPDIAYIVPELCATSGINTALKVYGVCDHGGGPSRRDIERLTDMAGWPVFPDIFFGTYREYFREAEKIQDQLPIVDGEVNFTFTASYTTQANLKRANRAGEVAVKDAETYGVLSGLATGFRQRPELVERAWKGVLFNQFHDILPGTGSSDTAEHAMGLFQNTMADAAVAKRKALEAIVRRIDTSAFQSDEDRSGEHSMGAGVGFGAGDFRITQYDRAGGSTRVYHIFNPLPVMREEVVEVVIWNWEGDPRTVRFTDGDGKEIPHQLLNEQSIKYYHHYYFKVVLPVRVPACGYSTYIMRRTDEIFVPYRFCRVDGIEERIEREKSFVLENGHIRAVFHHGTAALLSLTDLASGEEMLPAGKPAAFRYRKEVPTDCTPTASIIGQYLEDSELRDCIRIREIHNDRAAIKQWVAFAIKRGGN